MAYKLRTSEDTSLVHAVANNAFQEQRIPKAQARKGISMQPPGAETVLTFVQGEYGLALQIGDVMLEVADPIVRSVNTGSEQGLFWQ